MTVKCLAIIFNETELLFQDHGIFSKKEQRTQVPWFTGLSEAEPYRFLEARMDIVLSPGREGPNGEVVVGEVEFVRGLFVFIVLNL